MISARFVMSSVFASTSANSGTRSPVAMLTITTAASGASDWLGSLNVGKPSGDTPFGNIASIGAISEKPSHLLNSVGSTMMPSAFVGMASRGMSTRYPVADEASAFAYAIDGHGNMQ